MSDVYDPRTYYYTTYHLARDFIGTAAPFTFFLVLASILFPPVEDYLKNIIEIVLLKVNSWVVGLLFLAVYALLVSMAGVLGQRLALLFRELRNKLSKGKKREYAAVYSQSGPAIESLYARYIAVDEPLHVESRDQLTEKIDRLCTFFRIYNPRGYHHLYREYTFGSIYRQSIMYCLVLLVVSFGFREYWYALSFAVSAAIMTGAVWVTIRDIIQAEYEFILATASFLEGQARQEAK